MKRKCSVDGCDGLHKAKGLCTMHYQRVYAYGYDVPGPAGPIRDPSSTSCLSTKGYRILSKAHPKLPHPNQWAKGRIFEHTVVMSEMLDRPLRKGERVHHKNGIRDDNRPENLELWYVSHPEGQRVEDLLKFAHHIIDMYG